MIWACEQTGGRVAAPIAKQVIEAAMKPMPAPPAPERAPIQKDSAVTAPTEAVAEAVQALRGSELERAREIWRKKFGRQPVDAAERGKQMRFLASRGFGGDTIHKVVSGAEDE